MTIVNQRFGQKESSFLGFLDLASPHKISKSSPFPDLCTENNFSQLYATIMHQYWCEILSKESLLLDNKKSSDMWIPHGFLTHYPVLEKNSKERILIIDAIISFTQFSWDNNFQRQTRDQFHFCKKNEFWCLVQSFCSPRKMFVLI